MIVLSALLLNMYKEYSFTGLSILVSPQQHNYTTPHDASDKLVEVFSIDFNQMSMLEPNEPFSKVVTLPRPVVTDRLTLLYFKR